MIADRRSSIVDLNASFMIADRRSSIVDLNAEF